MLHLILADSEIETVPKKISSDKSIRRKAQRRGRKATELILDSNYFHKPMRKLKDSKRRGRPDIMHVCMLAALDTPLNREGYLDFCVHTRNNKIIKVDPSTRIPRSYNRFIGLMEQLFLIGSVPPEKDLMKLSEMGLAEKVEEIDPIETLAFSKSGRKISKKSIFQGIKKNEDICVIVGGFPHGDFLSEVDKLSDKIISIYPDSLDAITVVTHVIQFYEEEFLADFVNP